MGHEIKRVALDYAFPIGHSAADAAYYDHCGTCEKTPPIARLLMAGCAGRPDAASALSWALAAARCAPTIPNATPNPLLADDWLGDHDDCETPWWRDMVPHGEGWQLWQTVSDGPLSPVFATPEELIAWMAEPEPNPAWRGRLCGPWSQGWPRDVAERFVRGNGWIPSAIVRDGKVLSVGETVDHINGEGS